MRATFGRQEHIRFLHEGVAAILDHAWGDGVVMTYYSNDAGTLEGSLRDGARRHLVIGLKRKMARGDVLSFVVERQAMAGFLTSNEWLETTIDHPIKRLRCRVVFPEERPCRRAVLALGTQRLALPITRQDRGRTAVEIDVAAPQAHAAYSIHWSW
jgi:hypothetical protein